MSDRILHFGIGVLVGTVAYSPFLVRAWRRRELLSPCLLRLGLLSLGLGMWAVVPNLLRAAGLPAAFCTGWPMNLFMFHHLIDKLHPGGALLGELLVMGCFALQYVLVLVALARVRRGVAGEAAS